jgi:DNA uptake protein ComE-like DNA-binding protein
LQGGAPADSISNSKQIKEVEEKHETKAQEQAEEKTEHQKKHPVDINSASKEDLMEVPSITDAIADKIIAGRPYKSKNELLKKKILTKAELKKIRGRIVAKKESASSNH